MLGQNCNRIYFQCTLFWKTRGITYSDSTEIQGGGHVENCVYLTLPLAKFKHFHWNGKMLKIVARKRVPNRYWMSDVLPWIDKVHAKEEDSVTTEKSIYTYISVENRLRKHDFLTLLFVLLFLRLNYGSYTALIRTSLKLIQLPIRICIDDVPSWKGNLVKYYYLCVPPNCHFCPSLEA